MAINNALSGALGPTETLTISLHIVQRQHQCIDVIGRVVRSRTTLSAPHSTSDRLARTMVAVPSTTTAAATGRAMQAWGHRGNLLACATEAARAVLAASAGPDQVREQTCFDGLQLPQH